ncbi:MarR family winged helix-turn-helix transcriptional regulator [Pseudomonas panipatensis]|uniref:DNA-binding transcriptional regulator, MarR family n=1 Tax=Pseudomonas panipatensis TaxID=428992 RepID=A0A1G8MU30_9PSED|nr:MarR family transcriptional regulator [Pseudomonas panipatensis]SDI70830.1 DNA-binding transcriptional regulator, MarR family [Pseudomonas panipatensis]SMP78232.1 DNA-binding transcriptional regulator, MarR family [Pseudomonas panipatensis]
MPAHLPEDVFESIHAVMHLYRSRQYRVLRDGPYDLTHMEFKALSFFARHPDATLSDLVARSGRDKAQVARLIQGLKGKGFLEGKANPADKRSIRLHLTATGAAVHAVIERQGRHLSRVAVTGFSDDECAQLLALLERVHANLEAER